MNGDNEMKEEIDGEVLYYLHHYRNILRTTNPELSVDDFLEYIVPVEKREKIKKFYSEFKAVFDFEKAMKGGKKR